MASHCSCKRKLTIQMLLLQCRVSAQFCYIFACLLGPGLWRGGDGDWAFRSFLNEATTVQQTGGLIKHLKYSGQMEVGDKIDMGYWLSVQWKEYVGKGNRNTPYKTESQTEVFYNFFCLSVYIFFSYLAFIILDFYFERLFLISRDIALAENPLIFRTTVQYKCIAI